MKKIFCLILAAILFSLSGIAAYAVDEPELIFESAYNADKNQVSVVIYIENPGAVTAVDLRMGYDQNVYQFVESEDNCTISDAMVLSGQSVRNEGLVCTSMLFTEKCEESYLTDNRLYISTFMFSPLTEDYDINDFCLWAYSYEVDDKDISKSVAFVGNSSLKDGKTAPVTVADIGSPSKTPSSETSAGNWYIYVIAVVFGVAVVAGVAVIAVKSSDKDNESGSAEGKKE